MDKSAETIVHKDSQIGSESVQYGLKSLLGSSYATNWPLILFAILIPLRNVQLKYIPNFGAGINFLNVGLVLSFVGAVFVGGKLVKGSGINKWVLIFALYSLTSLFIGYRSVYTDTGIHFNFLKDTLIAISLLYIVQKSVRDWVGIKRIIIATMIPLPYMAYVVWNQYSSVAKWHYYHGLRISGTFVDLGANELGAFFVTTGLFYTALLVYLKDKFWKLLVLGGLAFSVFGLVYSYSRGGYVAFAVGAAAIFLMHKSKASVLAFLVVAALITANFVPSSVVERFESITTESVEMDTSAQSRFVFWGIAADYIKKSPVFGLGYHTFHHKEVNPFGMDTHNYFIKVMVEQGFVGFAILVLILLSIYKIGLRQYRESTGNEWTNGLGVGVIAILTGLIVGNMFGDRFSHYPMISYFWIFVGLLLAAMEIEKTKQSPSVAVVDLKKGFWQ